MPSALAFGGDSEGKPPNLVLRLAKDKHLKQKKERNDIILSLRVLLPYVSQLLKLKMMSLKEAGEKPIIPFL